MNYLRLLALAIVCLSGGTAISAGDRYFYCHDGKAYFCDQPAQYSEGCYVVRDETNVIKVDQYPVISNARAQEMLQAAQPVNSVSCCPPNHDDCPNPPHIEDACYCKEECDPVSISRPYKGLKSRDCDRDSFYRFIGTFEGTIPVPELEVCREEVYKFREKELRYACSDDQKDCDENCVVEACEVYEKEEECTTKCVMKKRKGPLLIAVRREKTSAGEDIIDVFIGNVGANTFPEYPTNLAILHERSQEYLRDNLELPNFDWQNDAQDVGDTNLIDHL